MINSSFEGWDTVLLDTVAYTQFLAYGHSCTPGYVVWACGKDPQYTLTEKVQAITALQSSLRGITECCCKTASLVAKRMLIKKSNVCPYLTFSESQTELEKCRLKFDIKYLRQEGFRKGLQLK